jgi:hypothetical protein
MNVSDVLCQIERRWIAEGPASEADIAELLKRAKVELPHEYIELLRLSNGGEGPLALPPLYFSLFPIRVCIALFHENQRSLQQFPSFVFFGSNGGGEYLAFDQRVGPPWAIVTIDPIAGPESAKQIAPNMATFVQAIGLEAEGRTEPIQWSDARQIALSYVKAHERGYGAELVLLDRYTIERSFGWVFFYDSKRHDETGDFRDAVAGNAPIVVTREDGRVHVTGTALPVEHYLEKFNRYHAR